MLVSLIALVGVTLFVPAPAVSRAVGVVAIRRPPLVQLVRAVKLGDEMEIERLATRIGVPRLERAAETGTSTERLAALRALPLCSDSWSSLTRLAVLAAKAQEPEVALAAATAARRIADGLAPERIEAEEIPSDIPREAAKALLIGAQSPSLAPAVRAPLVMAVAGLRAVTSVDEPALMALLADGNLDVRRAAAESLAGVGAADGALGKTLASDSSALVAAAAAASLCRDVASSPLVVPIKKGKEVKAPATATPKPAAPPLQNLRALAEARAAALAPPARERLRALAVDELVTLADRLDLLGCLRVASSPADRELLDQLAKKGPEALRRRAKSLISIGSTSGASGAH